ncbi:hypothetical protein QQ045_019449 [Rhodiola kirilowii]
MSAYVTCFLSCPLSSNKCQMIRGGTSAPSTAFFRTSRSTRTVKKSPMKVLAIIMADGIRGSPVNGQTMAGQTAGETISNAVVGTTSPNMKVVVDNDNQLVLEFEWPGVVSKPKHRVSQDYEYLIIEGKEKEDGAGKGASGSLMWSKSVTYDTHFRLPENWDKSSKIKAAFDPAREVMTIKVAKSKGLDDDDSFEWE